MDAYKLSDGTVITVSSKDMKLAKKFYSYQVFCALIMTLFPAVRSLLGDTMYSLFSDDELPHFVKCVCAAQMVIDRYGKASEYLFDDLYAMKGASSFYVYVLNGRNVSMGEHPDALIRELTVPDATVFKIIDLLLKSEPVKQEPEPVLVVEDKTPTLCDTERSQIQCAINVKGCEDSCFVCQIVNKTAQGPGVDLTPVVRQYPHCCRVSFDSMPISRIFTHLLSHDYNKILHFGSSFDKEKEVNSKTILCDTSKSMWYLCRMPWDFSRHSSGYR